MGAKLKGVRPFGPHATVAFLESLLPTRMMVVEKDISKFCHLTVASNIFRLRAASIFVTHVTRTQKPLQSDSQDSKNYTSIFSVVSIASWTIA